MNLDMMGMWPSEAWARWLDETIAAHPCQSQEHLHTVEEMRMAIHLASTMENALQERIGLGSITIYWYYLLQCLMDQDMESMNIRHGIRDRLHSIRLFFPQKWDALAITLEVAETQKKMPPIVEFDGMIQSHCMP